MRTQVLCNQAQFSAAVVAVVLLVQPGIVAQDYWHFQIDDPRPLAKIAQQVQGLCECIVTYEDPQWTREQVVDVTALRNGRLDQPVFDPIAQPSDFWFVLPPRDRFSADLSTSLRTALQEVRRSGNPDLFAVRQRGNLYHITPAEGSLLDVKVSLPATVGREGDVVHDLLRTLSAAQHTTIVLGETALGANFIELGPATDTAENFLTKLLTTPDARRSWQLLYDFGSQRYVIDIHLID